MKLRIFYSWQTTTDKTYNKNFISTAIEKAVKNIRRKPEFKDVEFEVQNGINREPGSPQVASKIIDDRIPKCDIFIADLSVVNQVNWFTKWIMKNTGTEFKPFLNNNVIIEYGVAVNSIGIEKIIGVLNRAYGSPHDNPDNIPFDIKHLKFPIEYEYSSKTQDYEKSKTQEELVTRLTADIRNTAVYALQHQKSRYNPFLVWSGWENTILIKEKFIPNPKTSEISDLILLSIKKIGNPSLRILGLSGLGKTRILLETFRPSIAEESILASSRVLYVNYNDHPHVDYDSIVTRIVSEKEDRIIVIDNCPKSIHRQLLKFTNKEENRLSLITIDSNPEENDHDKINGINYVLIKKEDLSSVVNEIIQRDFSGLGEETMERIKEFSQGIPLMAVLLGDSAKKGEKYIGKLDDKELLNKLLGAKGQEEKNRTILKSCSIFNFFGFYDDLATQVEFIAKNKNITNLTGGDQVIVNDFHEVCNYYLKREIFEKRGRFIGMRPFPLAISLAQEWLDPITPKRLTQLITDIAKLSGSDRVNLSEALSEQMKYLGYDSKALTIVETITGPDSPFDDAEVLNTELGSRLFRAFVEVNPIAISNNCVRLFSTKSTEDLLNIKEGRRNLVWVLEKLCFDQRTFTQSVKVLYQFAVAENETWANNATGQFLHLFNIVLSGTEATLSKKWEIIEWGLAINEKQFNALAIKAMKVGLNYGHFSRAGGAEKQGSKRLRDNEPTWEEIREYWNRILSKLVLLIKVDSEFSESAEDALTSHVRSVIRANQFKLLLPYLSEITELKKNNWDKGLDALKLAKKYDREFIDPIALDQLEQLISSLTKTDFITRYSTLSKSYHLETDESYSSEKIIKAIIELADEFISTTISWEESFPKFYSSQQVFSYHFGKRVYQLIESDSISVSKFITLSLEVISSFNKEERNVAVLGGFIAESNDQVKKGFYKSIYESDNLNYLLFYFLSIDSSGSHYFHLLFKLIDSGKCLLTSFGSLQYSNSLHHMSTTELDNFSERLFYYGNDGYEMVFELLFALSYNDESQKVNLYPILKKCIYKLGVSKNEFNHMDHFQWYHTISDMLKYPDEFELANKPQFLEDLERRKGGTQKGVRVRRRKPGEFIPFGP